MSESGRSRGGDGGSPAMKSSGLRARLGGEREGKWRGISGLQGSANGNGCNGFNRPKSEGLETGRNGFSFPIEEQGDVSSDVTFSFYFSFY